MNKEEIENIINDEIKKKNFTNKFVEITNLISGIYQLGFENGFNVACEIEKRKNETLQSQLDIANKKLEDMKEYINYLVIFEPNIGRFNKTIWGEELLSIIGGE